MNNNFFEYLNDFCKAYIDDILIYSENGKKHQEYVQKVLLKLCKAGLWVNIEKCQSHVQKTTILGLIVSTKDLRMNSNEIKVIINWQTPTSLKKVQEFVDFCNFYCCFIKDFSKTVKPLVFFIRKECFFLWSEGIPFPLVGKNAFSFGRKECLFLWSERMPFPLVGRNAFSFGRKECLFFLSEGMPFFLVRSMSEGL